MNLSYIDHIVYCVPDLLPAIEDIHHRTGIRPIIGGRHLEFGTKNALLHLGDKCYLEILAIDTANERKCSPRWMGIDALDRPRITRWSIKAQDIQKESEIVKSYHPEMGEIRAAERMTDRGERLQWEMILPLASPLIELIPFVTDWSRSSIHPADSLEQGCALSAITIVHPQPSHIQSILDQLNIALTVSYAVEADIKIEINSPRGMITL